VLGAGVLPKKPCPDAGAPVLDCWPNENIVVDPDPVVVGAAFCVPNVALAAEAGVGPNGGKGLSRAPPNEKPAVPIVGALPNEPNPEDAEVALAKGRWDRAPASLETAPKPKAAGDGAVVGGDPKGEKLLFWLDALPKEKPVVPNDGTVAPALGAVAENGLYSDGADARPNEKGCWVVLGGAGLVVSSEPNGNALALLVAPPNDDVEGAAATGRPKQKGGRVEGGATPNGSGALAPPNPDEDVVPGNVNGWFDANAGGGANTGSPPVLPGKDAKCGPVVILNLLNCSITFFRYACLLVSTPNTAAVVAAGTVVDWVVGCCLVLEDGVVLRPLLLLLLLKYVSINACSFT